MNPVKDKKNKEGEVKTEIMARSSLKVLVNS